MEWKKKDLLLFVCLFVCYTESLRKWRYSRGYVSAFSHASLVAFFSVSLWCDAVNYNGFFETRRLHPLPWIFM